MICSTTHDLLNNTQFAQHTLCSTTHALLNNTRFAKQHMLCSTTNALLNNKRFAQQQSFNHFVLPPALINCLLHSACI
jgi:hypothetical protein